jgi:hypothetical protein
VLATLLIQKKYRKYLAKKIKAVILLQRAIKKAILNPRTELCQKRLLREFNEM